MKAHKINNSVIQTQSTEILKKDQANKILRVNIKVTIKVQTKAKINKTNSYKHRMRTKTVVKAKTNNS